jgi:hypothetical protein
MLFDLIRRGAFLREAAALIVHVGKTKETVISALA